MKPTILIVEDNIEAGEVLQEFLSNAGYGVDLATSGTEALGLFHQNLYKILLTDFRLPDMDGGQLAQKCRVHLKNIFVIFLTGVNMESRRELLREKNTAHLAKPCKPSEILKTIQKILR